MRLDVEKSFDIKKGNGNYCVIFYDEKNCGQNAFICKDCGDLAGILCYLGEFITSNKSKSNLFQKASSNLSSSEMIALFYSMYDGCIIESIFRLGEKIYDEDF